MTPTEKKYSKLIGNMYWQDVSSNKYNQQKEEWDYREGKMLILISGIQKGGDFAFQKRDFYYIVQVVNRPFPCHDNEDKYFLCCKQLEECLKTNSGFHPVDSNEQATV
jgi:hypothetical protein